MKRGKLPKKLTITPAEPLRENSQNSPRLCEEAQALKMLNLFGEGEGLDPIRQLGKQRNWIENCALSVSVIAFSQLCPRRGMSNLEAANSPGGSSQKGFSNG